MPAKSFIYRFADAEVTEREFSLVKAGQTVMIEPKAFRVLVMLLRNPRKLMPKEELLSAVWGDAAVTENSLTRAIALLRRVLGDDAREPRFIETVATVGYRWICPVEMREDLSAVAVVAEETAAEETAVAPPSRTGALIPAPPKRGRGLLWIGLGAAVVLLAGIGWYLIRPLPPPRITVYNQITHDGRNKVGVGGTDGSRVYFTQFSPEQIAQVGVKGGEVARLPISLPGTQLQAMDVSPDGTNALVATVEAGHEGNPEWLVPIVGGAATRLGEGRWANFSPDGSSVIYSTANGEIMLIHIDGSARQKLANVGSVAFRFTWSPDGKVIRFDKQDGLWEMSSDGSGLHRLLPDWKHSIPCCGQWTHDGEFFLFESSDQLWALDERRGLFRRPSPVPIQLTTGPTAWGAPVVGRDGKTIFDDGSRRRGELTRIDLKTGSSQPFLGGISAEYVAFSPDGNSVAYVSYPEGILWRAARDGSEPMQLTHSPNQASNPRWSPDSKEIVFALISSDGNQSIRRISAADGAPLWLISEETAETSDPNWSPDGKRVVFSRTPGVPERDLRIVDLETKQVTVVPGSVGKWSPRWSPDGRYIAALIFPQVGGLPVYDTKLQQWTDLPVHGEVQYPNFSQDGKSIYFLHYLDQGVFRIPVAGGKEERVFDLGGWHLTGNNGFFLSLDPTGAAMVMRDVSSDDIYALTLEQ